MPSPFGLLNRLLPFATPGTPLTQDVLHLAMICLALYFAPQIQERLQAHRQAPANATVEEDAALAEVRPDVIAEVPPAVEDDLARPGAEDQGDRDDQHAPEEGGADHIVDGHPGPAREPIVPTHRDVGAKKAKALARRDQRRAYHEFQRSQGEAQRARDAEGAQEREAAAQVERERRRAVEAALEAKKAKERAEKRQAEEKERLEELRRREQVVDLVRERLQSSNMCDLFKVALEVGADGDEEWVEKILNASGMIGRRGDTMTMITSVGWAVRVTADDMQRLYQQVVDEGLNVEGGAVEPDNLAHKLETMLRG